MTTTNDVRRAWCIEHIEALVYDMEREERDTPAFKDHVRQLRRVMDEWRKLKRTA